MPSRNRVPNAAELVSRSLNCTRAVSPCERSDMVNASRHCLRGRLEQAPAYDEQIIARSRARVQPQDLIWFPVGTVGQRKRPKKRAAVSGGFEVDNREA